MSTAVVPTPTASFYAGYLKDFPVWGTIVVVNDATAQTTIQLLTALGPARLRTSRIVVVDPFCDGAILQYCDRVRECCAVIGVTPKEVFQSLVIIQNTCLTGLANSMPSYAIRLCVISQPDGDMSTLSENIYDWWQCLADAGKFIVIAETRSDAVRGMLDSTFRRPADVLDEAAAVYIKKQHFRVPRRD